MVPMVRSKLILVALAVIPCVLAVGPKAFAQHAPDDDNAATAKRPPAAVQRPEAVAAFTPEYPAEALRARIEGAVVLRLSIDAYGNVTEADVIGPAGHGFDEAARTAALRARYRPARRGDTNVASRILARIEFRLPEAPPMASSEEPSASSEGGVAQAAEVTANRRSRRTARLDPPVAETATEITVRGTSEADRRRQSAEAVTVVETERAKRESADMGEVLARTQGVGVQRGGGLGTSTRFSLNGLTDGQVRFFLDGVPLELAGYPLELGDVPVNLIERIEIYSGVVPIRFGADALGGAVNLATSRDLRGTHAGASYEVGSFATHRLTLSARNLHEPSGFFTRASGFFDFARNDYPINVKVQDTEGQRSSARVDRFHDRYRATGGNVELGFVDRAWAKRLILRAFVTDYDKQYQHNVVMTVPYGGVTYGETSAGTSLRYEQRLARGVSLDVIGGYTSTRAHFLDVATCVYDWFGRCVFEGGQPGETDTRPHDQLYWDHSAFGRMNLHWQAHAQHTLRASVAPTYLTRTGDERRQKDPDARDPLSADRKLTTLVSGLEYELDLLDDRLENILFAKHYAQFLASEEPRPGDVFLRRDRSAQHFGYGDALRFRFAPWLYAKASYEHATRLPRPDEVFGDNVFIDANLQLEPETSRNANLGLTVDARETRLGAFRVNLNGFVRDAKQLVVLLGNDRAQKYQNVFGARSVGVESALGWTSPREYVVLDGNLTYQDFRNSSSRGTFGDFDGDRIPNRPYLFANGSLRLQHRGVVAPRDELALTWATRYVHDYFRGWESIGLRESKQTIDSQLVHTSGVSYLVRNDHASVTSTFEVQNVTDEAVFDFFGVQRPGRAFYIKTTAQF
jgi:vitamin B12 transporter